MINTLTLTSQLAAAAVVLTLTAAHTEGQAANPSNNASEAVEFRKFCETAATSETLLEKEKFLAWCEAEAERIATSSSTATEPPGPETGISRAARGDAVDRSWLELTKRFGLPKAAGQSVNPNLEPAPSGGLTLPE